MGLTVEDLTFGYRCFGVLKKVNFSLEEGSMACLLGKNGAGKSTLFRCILGLLKGYQGRILVDGVDARSYRERQLASKIAYIPQNHSMAFSFSVLDMVLMGTTASLSSLDSPGQEQRRVAMEAITTMGISHLAQRSYAHISGGEQQLVLIARAIAQQAKILVMDEPCANLDYGNQVRVMEELGRLAAKGYLVLLSTHSPQHAFLYGDQALVLRGGAMVAAGPPGKVLTQEILESVYGIPIRLLEVSQGQMVCMPGRMGSYVGAV